MIGTRESVGTDKRQRLDDPAVVDRLVRRFTAKALDIMEPPREPTFMGAIDWECRVMNSLFLTITPNDDYDRGNWNTPDQLGSYMRQATRINGDIRFGVRDACMLHLDRVMDAIQRNESAEPLIANLVACLLGVAHPPESLQTPSDDLGDIRA